MVDNAFVGVGLGIVVGFFTILILYFGLLEERVSYNYLHQNIENNITLKEATYRYFPNEYKLDYDDWKQFDGRLLK